MDIERLEELKEVLNHSLFYFGRKSGKTNFPDTLFDVLKLIDEAITRQSATSEEVQRAIEQLKYAREQDREFDDGTFVDSLNLAITALQAYQPWIPVSERLPDGDMASVLIYTKEGGVAEGQYYPSIDSWKQFRWSVENSKVTHWKPLPEPPKGE